MKNTQLIKKIFMAAVFLLALFAPPALHAQTGFEDDVDDEEPADPEAPINGFIALGLACGAFLGYRFLKKEEQVL